MKHRHFTIFILSLSIIIFSVNCEIVPKCCQQGFGFLEQCMKTNNSLVNPYRAENGADSEFRPLHCGEEGPYNLDPDMYPKEDDYKLLKNSSILLINSQIIIPPKKYCMELIVEIGKVRPFLCFENITAEVDDANLQTISMYSVGLMVSLPFLFITFLVYFLVKELQTFHGKCLTSHIFALFMSYASLGFLQKFTADLDEIVCTIGGFSVQYFFLATFFWLNVMCIDIYMAFSSVRSRGGRHGGDCRKLLLYSLYAWGMPLLILVVTVGVDFTDLVPKVSQFKPNVGTNKCFFEGRTAAYVYFYAPMAILICVNLLLFNITAYRIWRTSRETAQLNRGDSRRHSDKQENERFKLYMKLFLVMGINWVAELVSFIVGEGVPHYLWYVTDLTNTLQGVFIFIIFVWKRRVRRLVWDRVCMLSGHASKISRSRGGTSSDATTTTTSMNNTAVSQLRLNSVTVVK